MGTAIVKRILSRENIPSIFQEYCGNFLQEYNAYLSYACSSCIYLLFPLFSDPNS